MTTFNLKVVTPEKEIFSGEVSELYLRTTDGEIGILPHHVSLMAQIIPGEMRIKQAGKDQVLATGAGVLQVAGGDVSVMTDLAERAEEIDEKAAEEAKKRAEVALEQTLSDEEYAETVAMLERSLAKLSVKRRYRTRI